MNPFDYTLRQQQSPTAAMASGMQLGLGVREIEQQRAAQEAAAAQQAQMNADLAAAARDPGLLPGVMTRYPQLAEKLGHAVKAQTEEQQRAQLQQGVEVASALAAGRPDMAAQRLRDQATAMRNSGDEQGAKRVEAAAQWAEQHPDSLLVSTLATVYSMGENGKRAADGVLALRRAPAEEAKAAADARKAGADATTAEAGAKYADQTARAALEKSAADLGLTKAQTTQTMALTRKYNAETTKALAEAANGDPTKRFDAEAKLRGEYTKATAGAQDTIEAFRRVSASKDDAVGDLSLIFGYMKMLDPGSVVREGEFANAQNAAGVPERITNVYNRIVKGERLTAGQRKAFVGQAGDLVQVAERRLAEEQRRLKPVLDAYKLDARNVFGDLKAPERTPQPDAAPKPIKNDAEYNALPSGATFVAPDGSVRRKP